MAVQKFTLYKIHLKIVGNGIMDGMVENVLYLVSDCDDP